MRTYKFRSEFTYELPKQTLTIVATGQMVPGHPGTYWEPPEGPEIHGDPEILITGENGETVKFKDLPELSQETIWERIYEHHEADDEI